MTTAAKKYKRPKAPARTKAEIAQANYDAAKYRLTQKQKKAARLAEELETTHAEIDEIKAEVDYLGANPALPKQPEPERQPVVDGAI